MEVTIRKTKPEEAQTLQVIQRNAFLEDLKEYPGQADCPANETIEALLERINTRFYYTYVWMVKPSGVSVSSKKKPIHTDCKGYT